MKIAIHGFYGMGNLGDEAILRALLQILDGFPTIEAVVFAKRPEQVSGIHGVRSVRSSGKRSFLRRAWEIGTSNLFVLGGGGLLKDYGDDSSSLEAWLRLLRLAQMLNVRTALGAVGVESIRYEDSKKTLRRILDRVDLAMVRDNHSKEVLLDIGVKNRIRITSDPAVLLADPKPRESDDLLVLPRIMICVRHWFSKGNYVEDPEVNENLIRSLAAAADHLVEHHSAQIDFVPFRTTSYDDDRVVANQVISHMKCTKNVDVCPSTPGVDDFIDMLDRTSLVIGMRLHSLILATGVGLPVIGLEYMPKVRAYMQSLNQGDYSLRLQEVTSDRLIGLVEDTVEQYSARSRLICSEICRLQEMARESLAELVRLAQGG